MNPFNDSEDEEIEELAKQFKQSVDSGNFAFFDNDDYQDIIIYLIDTGDFEYAKKAVFQAIQDHPQESFFRLMRAKLFALEFNFSDAMKELDYVEQNFEINPEFYIEKVLIARAANQPIDGIELLNKALDMDDRLPEAHLLLAHEFLGKRNIDTAVEHAVRAIQLDNAAAEDLKIVTIDFQDFLQTKDHILIQFFQRLTDELPMCASLWSGLGLSYLACSEYEQAIEAFHFQHSLDENDPVCLLNLADANYELGYYEEALLNFNAVSEKCDWLMVSFQKGNCYFQMKDYQSALNNYMQVLEIDPMYVGAITHIVKTFKVQGKYDEARAYLRMKYEENPEQLEVIQQLIELSDPEKDIDYIRELSVAALNAQEIPEHAYLHFFTTYCCSNNAADLGIEVVKDFLTDSDVCTDAHYFMAALLLTKGLLREACEYLELALQAAPDAYLIDFLNIVPQSTNEPEINQLLNTYINFDDNND